MENTKGIDVMQTMNKIKWNERNWIVLMIYYKGFERSLLS